MLHQCADRPADRDAAGSPDDTPLPRQSLVEWLMADVLRPFAPALALPLTLLWARVLCFDAADPDWPDRDRFLATGTGARSLIAALLSLTGHVGDLATHGAGLALAANGLTSAIGMALAERLLAARFGKSLVDHRSWAVVDAGELCEGGGLEAAALAAQWRLDKLTVLVGGSATCPIDELAMRQFTACGWACRTCDADDPAAIAAALSAAQRCRKPSLIACIQSGGQSVPVPAGDAARLWRAAGSRGSRARRGWLKRLTRHPLRGEFERVLAGRLPKGWETGLPEPKAERCVEASLHALPEFASFVPGGEAGLPGRQMPYGTRMLGTAAVMNGMALHGGVVPCGTTHVPSSDLLWPALRDAGAARRRVVYLLRDSGDMACSVERIAGFRSASDLHLLCPGDPAELTECFDLAIRNMDGPTVIACPPASTGSLRADTVENRCARGGYVLAEADGPRRATLIACGRHAAHAMAAREMLAGRGLSAAVVSLPGWSLFARTPDAWRNGVLGHAPRFGIEAGRGLGWERWLGPDGLLIAATCDEGAPATIADAVERHLHMLEGETS